MVFISTTFTEDVYSGILLTHIFLSKTLLIEYKYQLSLYNLCYIKFKSLKLKMKAIETTCPSNLLLWYNFSLWKHLFLTVNISLLYNFKIHKLLTEFMVKAATDLINHRIFFQLSIVANT